MYVVHRKHSDNALDAFKAGIHCGGVTTFNTFENLNLNPTTKP
jgi:hypothetical protein